MATTMTGPAVWFVTGSQSLYGEETLGVVAEHARLVAASLSVSDELPLPVTCKPVLTGAEGIRRLCLEASADRDCAGVIAWMHTFSPAKNWIGGLNVLTKPLLHLHTQFNRSLPWAEIDMDFMNLNQSAHGDREFGFIAARIGIPRKIVVGHWHDPAVLGRVGSWARAAAGWHDAQSLTVVRVGDNMREVAVTEGDKVEAQIRLGIAVNGYGVGELTQDVDAVEDAAVDELVGEYEEAYAVAPTLRSGGERRESLRDAARIELGLRAFLDARGARAFTTNFEDLGGLCQLPGIAVQRLMADGYGFGAEGDWKTAALLRVLKVIAGDRPGGTSFMEDYTYHFGPGEALILGAHMLEVCPSIAATTPRCEIFPLSIGGRNDPVRLVFTAAPGPAVVLGMLDLGDRLRLVANEVDVVVPEQELPRLPVAHALWKPRPDLPTAAEAWLLAGGPHHTVLTAALDIEPLVDLAEMAGLEFLRIDAGTDIRDFKRELRCGEAYHHVTRGL